MAAQLKPHVVIFPFMAEGHILPLLDLSKALSCQRIKVTIITTPSNAKAIAKKIVNYPAIHITEISFPSIAGLPIGCENTSQLPSFQFYIPFLIATKHLKQPFEQVLQEMKETNILPLCVISDFFLGWTFSVCQSFGLPRLVFHGMSVLSMAICKSSWAHGSKLRSKSISESLNLPGLNLPFDLTIRDLPEGIIYASDVDKDDPYFQLLEEAGKSESNSWGVVVNSFIELEKNYISSYEAFYNDNCKAWCLGPLLLYDDDDDKEIQDFKVRINGRNHQSQNQSSIYIKWLNEQVPLGSVIYISFGSQAEVSDAQLNDVAFGLEESGHFFIYVVRKKTWSPPNGLEQRIEGKGFIVRDWVDQRQILSHKSVGGFLSHCGWNSVIESISFGVPILAWPMIAFSDQSLNAKFVVEGLGIGVDIRKVKTLGIESCNIVSKKAICEGVKELMGEEKGKKARERAKALSRVSRQAVEEGGSSLQSLNQLIEKLQGEVGCVVKDLV